jgi:plastocyanin
MDIRRRLTPIMTFCLIAMIALVASCGKDPTGPGGGGGGAKELDSGDLAGNNAGVYAHTFNNMGTFDYHCIHHSMSGRVVVGAGTPVNVAVSIADNSFSPTPLSVPQGSTVTWTNTGNSVHTVTSL